MIIYKRLLIVAVFIVILTILRFINIPDYITAQRVEQSLIFLQNSVRISYFRSVFIYVILNIGATIATIPITVLLTVIGGFLFGSFAGALYAVIGATCGGIVLFLITRYLLGNYVQRHYATELAELNENIAEYGYWYCFILQLLPFTPTFLFNVLVGLTRISLSTFVITAFFGMFPGAFVYALIGKHFNLIKVIRVIQSTPIYVKILFVAIFITLITVFFFTHVRSIFFIAKRLSKRIGKRD